MSVQVLLKVVAEAELKGKEVLVMEPPTTRFFWDHGDTTYLCGKCKTILAEDVTKMPSNVKVLKCNKCGSYNLIV